MDLRKSRRNFMAGAVASAAALCLFRTPVQARQPVVHDVRIKSFKFVPDHIVVTVGDTIRWTNEDLAPHTATADEFGWDTEEISKGTYAEVVVQEGMETTYFCVFHPHMKGSLEIR